MERLYYTKTEVANMLGVNIRTITRMMDERRIPYSRPCGHPRFDKKQFHNWLEKRAVKTAI